MGLLYAVGGRQRSGISEQTEEWRQFDGALIVSVDLDTGRLQSCVEYTSPPEARPDTEDPSIVFKSGTLADAKLFVPTQTELLVYEVPSFRRVRYVSLPCFNDVHHVRPGPDGTLLVANTGLDMVVEIGADDSVRREWSVIDEDPWSRFSRSVDYRRVPSTKPHRSHPNHVFFMDDELWVTRCDQHDILCLSDERDPIPVGEGMIHDGLVHGDEVYFTEVNGVVIIVDARRRIVRERINLREIVGGDYPLGWCRGIEMLDDEHVIVAFSRLRRTRWRQNIRWVKRQLGDKSLRGFLPTRLIMLDLKRRRVCWETDLEPAGMNAVFSVHLSKQ